MNNTFTFLAKALEMFMLFYLGGTSFYLLLFSIASLFNIPKRIEKQQKLRKFVVLIPCYQEDAVILDVAKEALRQNYPARLFEVVIIADNFHDETVEQLQKLPLTVFNVRFEISTKTRAINYALKHLPDGVFDAACILDADNVMEADFLMKINEAFTHGYVAIQGHRVAKNINTPFAVLDAISEEINNQIFRKGQRVVGLSSALIGSAMAFEYTYFKNMMLQVEVVGGFDKELEIRILRDGLGIEYLPDAYVFDEKVQNVKVFSQQRRRWISAQIHYFGKNFVPSIQALFSRGNVEYFNKAVQYIQLPRILLIGVLSSFTLSAYLTGIPHWKTAWLIAFISNILALLFAVPTHFYRWSTLRALLYLPMGFVFMLLSLLRIRGANRQFIHTKHTYNAFQIKRKDYFHRKK